MRNLKDHFNSQARGQGRMDLVIYWGLVLALLDLCRKLGRAVPNDLPPPPRPG